MKTTIFKIAFIAIMVSFAACSSNETKEAETEKDTLSADSNVNSNSVVNSNDVVNSNNVICLDEDVFDEDLDEDVTTKTCTYKNVKIVCKGYVMDYRGTYDYEYSTFLKNTDGSYEEVTNDAIFNQNKDELLAIINSKSEEEFNKLANDPDSDNCFEGEKFTPVNFDDLSIKLEDDKFVFLVSFGLCSACRALDEASVEFSLDEMQKYLK